MRWCTYTSTTDGRDHVALLHDGALHALHRESSVADLLGEGWRDTMAAAADRARTDPFEVVAESAAAYRAPVPQPPSIRDFMAFEEHVRTSAQAMGHDVDPVWYEIPLFYFSNPAASRGAHEPVQISPGSRCFDYELEIAAVVGQAGSDLDPATAEEHIAGYTVLCDWSARDLQMQEMRGHLGPAKGKDGATSFSRYLVTPDELEPHRSGNAYDLAMTARVNGELWSAGTFATIYWSFGELLAHASRGTTLRPGDVIGSGTLGTGCILELSRVHGEDRYPWLRPGDVVTLDIEHVGTIETTIEAGRELTGPSTTARAAARRPAREAAGG